MLLKACATCGEISEQNRCIDHRPRDTRTRKSKGYDGKWPALSARARRMQPFCTDCGAVDDLQADHTPEAWARKSRGLPIRLEDIDVVCGPCNRRRGAARGADVRRP